MKKIHVLLSNAVLIALLISSAGFAQKQKYDYEKSRSISQTYPANGNDKLTISNQFGQVTVKTWSRNEVKVDIRIEVSSTVKEEAEDMFERIDVDHGKDGGNIYFKTDMEKNKEKKDKNYGNHSNSINIDYEVSMPANLTLDLENKFGKTTIPDLQGDVDIQQEFGDLEAGRLSNPRKVTVKFGSADIESVEGGTYDFQFAKSAAIRNASGDVKVRVQHCKSNGVVVYGNNLSSLNINAQHSDVALVVPRDMSAQYSVDTEFGSFNNNTSFAIREDADDSDRRGPRFNHKYRGTSGGGKTRVTLDGNFTDFFIGHEAPTQKDKQKSKPKNVRSV
ncbi:MAG TPA: hypothetical protein VEB42_03020 [Chitinophagaceae bacterium]|nr:hypothetical protein [Chitinophagaceae bacterium]